jgi:uncharacterized protein
MISRAQALEDVEAWVRDRLESNPAPGHGWYHVDRVRRLAVFLARAEGVDPWLAELAALIHDVGRTAPGPDVQHGLRSAEMARPVLARLPLSEQEREELLHAVRWHNSGRADAPLLRVLRDADMLDGLGAIGLMRAFMSKASLPPYDVAAPFEGEDPWPPRSAADQVRGQMGWLPNLNTPTARSLAEKRLAFMQAFVDQVRRELMDLE